MTMHYKFKSSRIRNISILHFATSLGLLAAITSIGTFAAHAGDDSRNKPYNSKGFEPKLFEIGTPLLGTDGWSTEIPPFLNPDAAQITDTTSSAGRKSVEVWGGNLVSSEGITAPYDAVGSYRRPLNLVVRERKQVIVIEAELRLETIMPPTDDDFFSITIAARSGAGETLGEIGLSSSGDAVAYDFNAPAGAVPLFTAPITMNEWHRVSIVADFSGEINVVSYYLDGVLLGDMPTTSTSDVLLRGAVVVYALPDSEDNHRAAYIARFDNFQVSAHPAGN